MKKDTKGGAAKYSGTSTNGNFNTTVGAGTLEYLQKAPNAGRLVDVLVTIYRLEFNHTSEAEINRFINSYLPVE